MTRLSKVRKALFVIMLIAVAAPAALQARLYDDCVSDNDCRDYCGAGACWIPITDSCLNWYNCATYSPEQCVRNEGLYNQCYCGKCDAE